MRKEKELTVRKTDETQASEYSPAARNFYPSADIYETGEGYHVHLDMPGVKKEDVKIRLEEGEHLLVEAKIDRKNRSEGRYLINECYYTGYHRHFHLPSEADKDKIDGEYKDGVLKIHIHKREEVKPREISIN